MKKLLSFLSSSLILVLCSIAPANFPSAKAYNQTSSYGYMKCDSSCLFFKTSDITNMNIDNIYFIIPEGYFVKKISEVSSTTIQVSYMNKTGFVMTERVREVDFLPEIKYLQNITFDISSFSGTQLWSVPSTEDSSKILVKIIPAGTKKLTYVAEARGEIPVGSTSPVWFYCYYSPVSDPTSVFEGYVHSEKTSSLSPIPENLEGKILETTESQNQNTSSSHTTLPKTVEIVLISLIALPILVILVLLFLSGRRKEKAANIAASNSDNFHELDNTPISRKNTQPKNDINYLKNKKFSLKKSFDNFMFEPTCKNSENHKTTIAWDSLEDNDDDDLL
ncbi:MAG: hypothetical protein IJW24_03570 [Clostridia bacterium]|nr:hypothetical protein [Clostridia bacterium]